MTKNEFLFEHDLIGVTAMIQAENAYQNGEEQGEQEIEHVRAVDFL